MLWIPAGVLAAAASHTQVVNLAGSSIALLPLLCMALPQHSIKP
jgi:hypothetical protein